MFVIKIIESKINNFVNLLPKTTRLIHKHNVLFKHETGDYLNVVIRGESLQFPNVWLRENCRCEQCYHTSAQSRILDWSKFDINVKPTQVRKHEDTNSLQVTWDDGHTSLYNFNWLKFRSFTPESQKKYTETIYKPKTIPWHGKEFSEILYKRDYSEILNSDRALYEWLHKFAIYGVALIQNTPHSETAVDGVVERIGFNKRTHYGSKFIVQHVYNDSSVDYLSRDLQLHIDLPYYEYCPGSDLLHYFVQTVSQGGENLLSDCHFTANYMKEKHPEQYQILTDVEVEWRDVGPDFGNDFFKLHRCPVISLNGHGEIVRINFSIPKRGSHFPGPIESVKPWYEAHSMFWNLNHKFAAKFKPRSGDILAFNNIRLLHGRNMYDDSSDNVRKIIGTHLDWDELYSKLRCLKVKLENEDGIC